MHARSLPRGFCQYYQVNMAPFNRSKRVTLIANHRVSGLCYSHTDEVTAAAPSWGATALVHDGEDDRSRKTHATAYVAQKAERPVSRLEIVAAPGLLASAVLSVPKWPLVNGGPVQCFADSFKQFHVPRDALSSAALRSWAYSPREYSKAPCSQ
jgi:hypothetical protein